MENLWKTIKDILLPLIVAGLIWLISVTNENSTELRLLQKDVERLDDTHFSPQEAMLLEAHLMELNRRLDRIEQKLTSAVHVQKN